MTLPSSDVSTTIAAPMRSPLFSKAEASVSVSCAATASRNP